MRRFAAFVGASVGALSLMLSAAPAAHADVVVSETVTLDIPTTAPTLPPPSLVSVCLTVREVPTTQCLAV